MYNMYTIILHMYINNIHALLKQFFTKNTFFDFCNYIQIDGYIVRRLITLRIHYTYIYLYICF